MARSAKSPTPCSSPSHQGSRARTPRTRTTSQRPSPRSWVSPRAAALPAPSLARRLVPTRPTRTSRLSRRRWSRPWASAISKRSPDESFRGQRPAAASPSPTVRKYEASFGLGVLDHLEPDAMLGRRLFGRLAGVALIDLGHLDVFARDVLNLTGKFADLGAVLIIGWWYAQPQPADRLVD